MNFIKISLACLFSVLCCLLAPDSALAHTPHDDIFQVEISPSYPENSTVFVISRENLFKSENGGSDWKRIVQGLDNKRSLYSLAIDASVGKTLFLSSLGDGIYRSQDGGNSWQKVNQGLANLTIDLIEVSSYSQNFVLAAGQAGGLYRSKNGGENWQEVISKPKKTTAIAFLPQSTNPNGDAAVVVGDSEGGIAYSRDAGESWDSLDLLEKAGRITTMALSPNFAVDGILFVGTESGEIFKSTDFNVPDGIPSFTAISHLKNKGGIASLAVIGAAEREFTLLASTQSEGLFVSPDTGQTWQRHAQGLTSDSQSEEFNRPDFSDLKLSPNFDQDQTLFLAGYNGLFKSTNAGENWQEVPTLSAKLVTGFAISPNHSQDSTIAVGTYIWGIHVSQDQGENWQARYKGLEEKQRLEQGIGVSRIFNIVFSPNFREDRTLFAATWYRFLKSTDGGKRWQAIAPFEGTKDENRSLGYTIAVSPDYATDQTLYLGTREGHILKSTNRGRDFSVISTFEDPVIDIEISPNFTADQTLFVGIPSQVHKSVDGGVNWQRLSQGITLVEQLNDKKEEMIKIVISPNYASDQVAFVGTAEGIFRTQNGGQRWQKLNQLPASNGYVEGLDISPNFSDDGTLITSIKGEGIFKSVDGGTTFEAVGEDLLNQNYQPANLYGFPLVAFSSPIQFSPTYANDQTIYAFAETHSFISKDAGETWTKLEIPISDYDNVLTRAYLSYLDLSFSPKKVLVVAVVLAILGYPLLGFFLGKSNFLNKRFHSTRPYIKAGGTFAIFIVAFLTLLNY